MKNRKFWKILLGVVVAIVVLGAVGFGFYSRRMWGGHFGAMGKMPHDYDGVMPCEGEGETGIEDHDCMHHGSFRGYGMGGMSHMRGGWGMHGGWGRRGHSPLTGLLLLVLIVMGLLHFKRYRRYHKFFHHGHMHMHPHAEGACCCGDEPEGTHETPDTDVNQPETE